MDSKALENHKIYSERIEFYRGFGYDLEKEREFIFNAAMPLSGKILEIGTGKGHFALVLAKKGLPFVTVDVSAQEQEFARLNIRYFGLDGLVDFRIENAERLSFPDANFDAIFSVNVFHHLEKPYAVLNETIRVLRPKGKIVLSDFTQKGLEIINACHSHEGRHHDHSRHSLDEARVYFTDKGFMIEESQSEVQRVIIAHRH